MSDATIVFAIMLAALGLFIEDRLSGAERNRPTLRAYAKRRAIEYLFAEAKTRGLNIEDTRLTSSRKRDLLMAIVAWAAATAASLRDSRASARKARGYLSSSWFRTGLDHLRRLLSAGQAADALYAAFKTPRIV